MQGSEIKKTRYCIEKQIYTFNLSTTFFECQEVSAAVKHLHLAYAHIQKQWKCNKVECKNHLNVVKSFRTHYLNQPIDLNSQPYQ